MKCHGPAHHSTILTEEDVRLIRELRFTEGWTYYKLARRFGVSRQAIFKACNGFTWKHVK